LNVERRQSASATRVAGVAELSRQRGGVASRKAGPEAAQAVLGAERQRLQHLLAVSPAIIYSTKASGDFACTFVSENIRTIMGFAPEDMLADPKCWPDRLHPEDGPRVFEELPPLIERGGGMLVYRFRRADGSYLWIQDSFKVVNDEHGQPMELVGAWADISERRRAEQQALEANAELQKTKRSLSRLIESSPSAIIATDKSGNVTLFNEGAEALLGYRAEEVVGRSVALLYGGEAGMNEVLREMERRGGTVSGIDSLLWAKDNSSIPVLISASLLFDDDGRQIGTVGFATDLRERRRTLEELGGVRLRLQHLLAVSPAIVYSTKASGDFACTFVSENIRTIMGFAPEDMLADPKCWPDRLHPEDGPRVFEELPPLIERGGGMLVYRFRHADGSYLWIQDSFKVVNDEHGQPMELVGAWADISERRRAEQQALEANAELQKTKRSLSRLIESSPDGIIATDKNGNVTLFSEGAETLLGYRTEEVIGRSVALLYGGEAGAHEVMREMHKRGGTVSGFEGVAWAKDGSAIPVLISASLLFDDDGHEIGTVGFATDLRERKRGEEAVQKAYDELEKRVEERTLELREARGRLQYLLTVTPGIMYTNKASGNFACTFVSQNVETIMGFSGWEMIEDSEFWLKRLHPNDVKTLFSRMAPLIDAGGGAIEYRFRHRDGHYVWIQDTFKVVPDEAGKPYEIVGSWADITDRKQVEQALGERMALMNDLQNLVAASPAVIYTTKATDDFACTFVSENLVTTMGYAPWEMRDDPKFWSKRVHPDDASAIFSGMDKLVGKGGGAIEYRFRHRRGHYIWVQDTFSVKCDKDGQPKELVGSWADITDRKHIEAEMTRLAAEVELRNRFIRETFGRYLTDQVVDSLLESPAGLKIGGEKRKVTMLMADLRGFTALSERLDPKEVVALLNRYLSSMVAVVKKYGGTIEQYIGDAIFVLFGAPVWKEDDAQRAVACAVEMELAMASINEANARDGLPELEMGIGLHTGQVVAGNIGAPERMQYGVIGNHVNLTQRIQACTSGGQILISETTRREVGGILRLGRHMEVKVKGVEQAIALAEVHGIGGSHKLSLLHSHDVLAPLKSTIPVRCSIIEGGRIGDEVINGALTKLSSKRAELRLDKTVHVLADLKMQIVGDTGREVLEAAYCKVEGALPGRDRVLSVRFTSLPNGFEVLLHAQDERVTANSPTTPPGAARSKDSVSISAEI
jgi:PAS domain S-box-containing protein